MAFRAIRTIQAHAVKSFCQRAIVSCFQVGSTIDWRFIHNAIFRDAIHFAEVSVYLYVLLGDVDDVGMDEDRFGILGFRTRGTAVLADERRAS